MTKKILSFITALGMSVACSAGVTATAAETQSIYILPNHLGYYYGFMVQTDGTELTEDMIPFKDDAMYSGIRSWSVVGAPLPWGGSIETTYEGDTESAYIVGIRQNDPELMSVYARELELALDCVVNTCIFEYTQYGRAAFDGDFDFVMKDPSVTLDDLDIPELEDAAVYSSYAKFDYTAGSALREAATAYVEEVSGGTATVRNNVNIYEQEFLYQFAEELEAKYSEYFSDVIVGLLFEESLEAPTTEVSSTLSAWQTAGDHNADGEVNSNDAADLLVQAAQEGVAEASETAVSPDSDVNLDGVADSTDAAYILQYAALKGSGADADWVEILKK